MKSSSAKESVEAPVGNPTAGIGPRRDRDADEGTSKQGSVDIAGLVKKFGDFVAVDHLDLSVAPGEFISLLGPSGCGKTTTLRMLAGFEFPDEGLISVSGIPVSNLPPHRRDVNTVFQAYALFPHMTVAENVAFGLRQHRTPRAEVSTRVAEALQMVQMLPMADRRPLQLSGGQQQRVALARALVNRPSVLLLDEPLAALDRKLREEMQIELKLMQRDLGITFIFVTHDQGEALSMSDRIAVMRAGRIEQLADPYTIYDAPSSAFVAGFIGQQNFFRGTFDAGPVPRVSTHYGSFVAERGEPIASGRALVAVRPEVIRIADAEEPSEDGNSVAGTLASIAHLGDVLQYVVLVGSMELIVRTPRASARRLELGARVICTFSAADAYLFEDTGDVDEAFHSATPQL